MNNMTIDIETRSDRDLTKCGVYAYADSPYFAITLVSLSVDGGAVQTYDLANGETLMRCCTRWSMKASSSRHSMYSLNECACQSICARIIRRFSAATVFRKIPSVTIFRRWAGIAP